MKRIIRFIKALYKYILYGKRVTFVKYCDRLNICCICSDFDSEKWTCKKCGCYVDKKAKMSTEICPKHLW